MDRTVSSYAPTIRVLEHVRARPATGPLAEALVVSVMEAKGHDPLPGAAAEAAAVTARFATARQITGPDATRDRVLEALPRASLVHFACHAYSDATAPSAGRLILHDAPLTVLDINRLRIGDGRLAFLSACATAQGSLDLLDETIHLTSAFQLAGYAHVIGTLWPTDDATATTVADTFYTHLSEGRPAHAALHEAVSSLRAQARRTPSLWASYIHVGP
jgi:CHAT domain-containing protein